MASYASLQDVQDRLPQFQLTATSKPSSETAQTYLDDVHAEFESALENLGYRVPITGPKAIAQAIAIECQGTIARILYARAAAVGGEAAMVSADRAQKMYDAKLEALSSKKSPIEFTDAQRTGLEVPKPEDTVMGLTRDEDGNPIEPRTRMSQIFLLLVALIPAVVS